MPTSRSPLATLGRAGRTALPGSRRADQPGAGRPVGPVAGVAGAVLVAAIVVALVVTSVRLGERDATLSARASALDSARSYAVEVASYDYRSIDQGFLAVVDHAVPSFQRQFTVTSRSSEPLIVEYHGQARANVVAAGVSQATGDQATVVLFVNQTVTNDRSPRAQVHHDRMVMRLRRSGGQWLISQVSLL